MSTWNYRVVRMSGSNPEPWVHYAIHEVYYEQEIPNLLTEKGVSPSGEDRAEFLRDWKQYQRAIVDPVLLYDSDAEKFIGEEPPLNTN